MAYPLENLAEPAPRIDDSPQAALAPPLEQGTHPVTTLDRIPDLPPAAEIISQPVGPTRSGRVLGTLSLKEMIRHMPRLSGGALAVRETPGRHERTTTMAEDLQRTPAEPYVGRHRQQPEYHRRHRRAPTVESDSPLARIAQTGRALPAANPGEHKFEKGFARPAPATSGPEARPNPFSLAKQKSGAFITSLKQRVSKKDLRALHERQAASAAPGDVLLVPTQGHHSASPTDVRGNRIPAVASPGDIQRAGKSFGAERELYTPTPSLRERLKAATAPHRATAAKVKEFISEPRTSALGAEARLQRRSLLRQYGPDYFDLSPQQRKQRREFLTWVRNEPGEEAAYLEESTLGRRLPKAERARWNGRASNLAENSKRLAASTKRALQDPARGLLYADMAYQQRKQRRAYGPAYQHLTMERREERVAFVNSLRAERTPQTIAMLEVTLGRKLLLERGKHQASLADERAWHLGHTIVAAGRQATQAAVKSGLALGLLAEN